MTEAQFGDSVATGDKYRSFIYGEGEKDTVWSFGAPPDYSLVNKLFEEGRTKEWPVGSLEEQVQRIVKTYEMEMVHKPRPSDKKSVNTDKFLLSVNGLPGLTAQDIKNIGGSYNTFLQTSLPPEVRIYDPEKETMESSNTAFKTTFARGFALEIVEVYRGPPDIVFRFRHWGFMEGPFQGREPTGEMVEFYGVGVFHMDAGMRVEKVEFFYDRGELLAGLLKGRPQGDGSTEKDAAAAASSSGCPFMKAAH